MKKLARMLIAMGTAHPELQPNLRPIIDHLRSARASNWSGPIHVPPEVLGKLSDPLDRMGFRSWHPDMFYAELETRSPVKLVIESTLKRHKGSIEFEIKMQRDPDDPYRDALRGPVELYSRKISTNSYDYEDLPYEPMSLSDQDYADLYQEEVLKIARNALKLHRRLADKLYAQDLKEVEGLAQKEANKVLRKLQSAGFQILARNKGSDSIQIEFEEGSFQPTRGSVGNWLRKNLPDYVRLSSRFSPRNEEIWTIHFPWL